MTNRHEYIIDLLNPDHGLLDELLSTIVRQARLSSQYRTQTWELSMDCSQLRVSFASKMEFSHFKAVLEAENHDFLVTYGFANDIEDQEFYMSNE